MHDEQKQLLRAYHYHPIIDYMVASVCFINPITGTWGWMVVGSIRDRSRLPWLSYDFVCTQHSLHNVLFYFRHRGEKEVLYLQREEEAAALGFRNRDGVFARNYNIRRDDDEVIYTILWKHHNFIIIKKSNAATRFLCLNAYLVGRLCRIHGGVTLTRL